MDIQKSEKDRILLVERILAGETEAFKVIIENYGRLVNHIVYRMIRNEADREDICQDVFLRVFKNLSSYRSDAKFSTWIGKIATNRCLDFLDKKSLPLADDNFEDAVESSPDTTDTPDIMAEQSNISELLKEKINLLPPIYKTILTLYHLDEQNYAEIGSIMNLPEGTVKSYLFRARKLLREKLTAQYNQEELWQ